MVLNKAEARHRGITLIEMMVALVIVSLLLLVALPGYQRLLLKSHRAAGKGALLDVLSRQAQYYVNHKEYARSLEGLGLRDPYHIDAQAQGTAASQAVYKVELVFDAETYLGVTAIPQNRQVEDRLCHTFTISREGVRSVSGSLAHTPYECWR